MFKIVKHVPLLYLSSEDSPEQSDMLQSHCSGLDMCHWQPRMACPALATRSVQPHVQSWSHLLMRHGKQPGIASGQLGPRPCLSGLQSVVWSVIADTRVAAVADIPSSLRRVTQAWLVSMPVAACQLVLTTASESHALIGEPSFAARLPLAASGTGFESA